MVDEMEPFLSHFPFLPLLPTLFFLSLFSHSFQFPPTSPEHCERIVMKWESSSAEFEVEEDTDRLRNLLFFLHIPRTGGRAYSHCFLRNMYSRNMECPHSYDKLRFDPSQSKCRLLVSHDDYSLMSKFPSSESSVLTIMRDPVDRVYSTYGFSVEVAARFLVYHNLSSSIKFLSKLKKKNVVSTMDIWPWKYLVTWMRDDLFSRRHHGIMNRSNSYNLDDELMSLKEFIEDPITKEIVHNGATFQVAGITNNSYSPESHHVRLCVQKHPTLGRFVLNVAKRRLDKMLYVGLTENHKKSGEMFARIVASQIIDQFTLSGSDSEHFDANKLEDVFPDTGSENGHYENSTMFQNSSLVIPHGSGTPKMGNMTVGALMDVYENCSSRLRETQARRRRISLTNIYSTRFSKEDRSRVSESVIERIRSLNSLDMELYKHAQALFHIQHNKLIQKREREDEKKMMNKKVEVVMTCCSDFILLPLFLLFPLLPISLLCLFFCNKFNVLKLKT